MVKQLIMIAIPLLIYDTPEANQCARASLDFIMLAWYISHDEKTLR